MANYNTMIADDIDRIECDLRAGEWRLLRGDVVARRFRRKRGLLSRPAWYRAFLDTVSWHWFLVDEIVTADKFMRVYVRSTPELLEGLLVANDEEYGSGEPLWRSDRASDFPGDYPKYYE